MESPVISGDLWAYRAQLAGRLQEIEAELQRVNALLRAYGAGENRTLDLLRACIAASPAVDARAALDYLVAHGWQAEARDNALNAVRSALAHLASRGDAERVRRGVYRAPDHARIHPDAMAAAG
jgi:hypothetical protein